MTNEIYKIISQITSINISEISDNNTLIGSSSILDSMKLVELCLALEDLSEKFNFRFDWTSEYAMSKSQSTYRNVGSLVEEFKNQMKQNTK